MRGDYVRQLRELGRLPVPPEVLSGGRARLVETVRSSPMIRHSSPWLSAAAFRPLMASLVVMSAVTGGGTYAAASAALPGDTLYALKIASEDVREYAAFTPERRLLVQAARASRRLAETADLLAKHQADGEDRAVLVRDAMDHYKDHLFDMNETAVKMDEGSYGPEDRAAAREAAEKMLELHAELVGSADVSEPAVASVLLNSIDESMLLEDDMRDVTGGPDAAADEGFERHRSERFEKMNEDLKRLRSDLDERRNRGEGDGDTKDRNR